MWSRDSAVSMTTRVRAGRLRNRGSIPSKISRTALGPTQVLIQGVSGIHRGNRALGDEADHSCHLVPRTEMSGALHSLSFMPKGIYYLNDFCENRNVISVKTTNGL
jgi:hypothetical protein